MNIDLEKLKFEKEENFKERLAFIKLWVDYIKNHSDEEWSEQQNIVINSQINQNLRRIRTSISAQNY